MKVAVVTSFPGNPTTPRGGVEAVSVNLVGALARQPGVDVHVVTTDRKVDDASISTWEGATIHRLPMGSEKLLSYILNRGRQQVVSYVESLRPNVVHAHDFYGMMMNGLSIPRVFTIHGFIHEDTKFAGERFAAARALLWKRYEVASWRLQPHIVSISPYVRERLRGIAQGVIHDIENPIAAEIFDIPRAETEGTIFCAALICRRKNTLGLVQSFARIAKTFAEATLRLAGAVEDPEYGRAVEQFIASSNLQNRVYFLGSIPTNRIREELSRASIFALPSFEEGAPMGVAEAMAAQVPVVTSNRCGMPYMVRNAETGYLVDPNNPDDIASAFAQLLSNQKLRRKMGANARQFALDRFHPDRVAERTLLAYSAALKTK